MRGKTFEQSKVIKSLHEKIVGFSRNLVKRKNTLPTPRVPQSMGLLTAEHTATRYQGVTKVIASGFIAVPLSATQSRGLRTPIYAGLLYMYA